MGVRPIDVSAASDARLWPVCPAAPAPCSTGGRRNQLDAGIIRARIATLPKAVAPLDAHSCAIRRAARNLMTPTRSTAALAVRRRRWAMEN